MYGNEESEAAALLAGCGPALGCGLGPGASGSGSPSHFPRLADFLAISPREGADRRRARAQWLAVAARRRSELRYLFGHACDAFARLPLPVP